MVERLSFLRTCGLRWRNLKSCSIVGGWSFEPLVYFAFKIGCVEGQTEGVQKVLASNQVGSWDSKERESPLSHKEEEARRVAKENYHM